jgi:hypothetical protein
MVPSQTSDAIDHSNERGSMAAAKGQLGCRMVPCTPVAV